MARPKSDKVQIDISIPSKWKTELKPCMYLFC